MPVWLGSAGAAPVLVGRLQRGCDHCHDLGAAQVDSCAGVIQGELRAKSVLSMREMTGGISEWLPSQMGALLTHLI